MSEIDSDNDNANDKDMDIRAIETEDGTRIVVNGEVKTPEDVAEDMRRLSAVLEEYHRVMAEQAVEALRPLAEHMLEGQDNE